MLSDGLYIYIVGLFVSIQFLSGLNKPQTVALTWLLGSQGPGFTNRMPILDRCQAQLALGHW